jgi:haloacetate dehalogenase
MISRQAKTDCIGFNGFRPFDISTPRGQVHGTVGGKGAPVLLLHGYPETHVIWREVAPLLAERHTVVATDLAGYGTSFRPTPTVDHSAHSKREMALDQVKVMDALGFDRFAVVGHDRGGRVGYRMALDHPARVSRLAVLDIVPTGEAWRRADPDFARTYWHWALLALPSALPERLIGAHTQAFFDLHVRDGMGLGDVPEHMPPEVLELYRRILDDPGAVEAMCEDYRAGATIDVQHDEDDLEEGTQIECSVLVLWAARGALPRLYPDVLEVWRPWTQQLRGRGIDAKHFLAEDQPEETAKELFAFLEEARDESIHEPRHR